LKAHFSYQNNNEFAVGIVLGTHNGFNPAPSDRGQPDLFFAGNNLNVFDVDFNGEEISWTLLGNSVKANRSSKLCKPNTPPTCNAGQAYQLACQGTVTNVHLDGSASTDPEGTKVFYSWETNCAGGSLDDAHSAQPVLSLTNPGDGAPQTCQVKLTLTDGVDVSSCEQTVSVGSCNVDCNGTRGGNSEIDACGVCGGDGTTCLDCSGTPFGTAKVDKCGVCGGTDACLDCKGIPNGTTTVDRCGTCGGDGSTCLGCVNTDISDQLAQLNAGEQYAFLKQQTRNLAKDIMRDPRIRAYPRSVQRRLDRGALRYSYLKELLVSLPNVVVNCTNAQFCAEVDNGPTIDKAQRYVRKLSYQINRTIRQQLLDRKAQRTLLKKNDALFVKLRDSLRALPRFGSKCK
jgi:hypothetical protein